VSAWPENLRRKMGEVAREDEEKEV